MYRHSAWLLFLAAAVLLLWFIDDRRFAHAWKLVLSWLPRGMTLSALLSDLHGAVTVLLVLALLSFLASIAWWYATLIELDDIALVVRTPFASNSIPLEAIQDIQTVRPFFGILLNYGTLVVYSGRETECITFVPDVEKVAQTLYRH